RRRAATWPTPTTASAPGGPDVWPPGLARFVSDDGDSGQSFAVLTKCSAHCQYPAARVTLTEQVPGEPQRTEQAFVGDHPPRFQQCHRRGCHLVDDQSVAG